MQLTVIPQKQLVYERLGACYSPPLLQLILDEIAFVERL